MADEAVLPFGAKFYLHDGSGLVKFDGVTSVNRPNLTVDSLESTHHGSVGGVRTFIPGLADPGELKIGLWYSPGSTTDTKILAALAARTARAFKLVVVETDGTTQDVTGTCIPLSYEVGELGTDAAGTATFTAKVSGSATQAAS
ncbi:MAG: hypothetical protein QOH47_808 [Sphingomonadales bacterium]|jgi:hypothetical protein|nr:hypothetical protein [Sphingomonadales bacterium]